MNASTLPTSHGIVIKKNQTIYTVQMDGRLVECTLAGRMLAPAGRAQGKPRQSLQHHPESLAIGDAVAIQPGESGRGLIVDLLPRRNQLSRRSAVPMPTAHAHEQVIAANLDQVIPVFAVAQPSPKWNLLDRYLAAIETAGLDALICITKLDLVRDRSGVLDGEIQAAVDEYRRIGYPVILANARCRRAWCPRWEAACKTASTCSGSSSAARRLSETRPQSTHWCTSSNSPLRAGAYLLRPGLRLRPTGCIFPLQAARRSPGVCRSRWRDHRQ